MDRRHFLAAATAMAASPGWAAAASPAYLTAARRPDNSHALIGLSREGRVVFDLPLPARGHAAAAHPVRPEAVAFARRPGTFARVIDCATGRETARLTAPDGRHFYGHGAFSADGARLYTTENAYDTGAGRVGIWDAADGYRRIGEIASGGIGPHDIRPMPDGDILVVANGGIRTHPDYGREKLNLPDMRPNIAYLSTGGSLLERVAPPLHHASTRHLALRADGLVAVAMQWQGSARRVVPLLALHRRGEKALTMLSGPEQARLRGYAGSVAFSGDGTRVAISAPRGGRVQIHDVADGRALPALDAADACGLAPAGRGFAVTSGAGEVFGIDNGIARRQVPGLSFDNHLVAVKA